MTEATLKSALAKKLRLTLPHVVVLCHSDRVAGVPDMSVTWNKMTSWWELKLAIPHIRSRGVQDLKVRELDYAGHAFYVVYQAVRGVKRTLIANPRMLHEFPETIQDNLLAKCDGFNHDFVVNFVRELHNDHQR